MSRTDVRRRQRLVRRRRKLARTLVVATLAASGLGFLAGHAVAGAARPGPAHVRAYVVRPGDTLWTIAGRVDAGADPRAVVDALIAGNHLRDAAIAPGQVLRLPASAG
jgi:nucleoid-associated protein YgaU